MAVMTPADDFPGDDDGEFGGGELSRLQLLGLLRRRVARRLAHADPAMSTVEYEGLVKRVVDDVLGDYAHRCVTSGVDPLGPDVEGWLAGALRDAMTGLGGLQRLLDRTDVENVWVCGCDDVRVRYVDGRVERAAPVAVSDAELVDLIQLLAARAGVQERRFDRGAPRLSLQLPDGHRLFAIMSVTRRPTLAIRRHRFLQVTLADLVGLRTLTRGLAALLAAMVRARLNIIICGGTNAGKTTLARGLCAAIPPEHLIITIEDAYELALDADPDAHPYVIAMQAREANIEGHGEVDMAELTRWALRMSPDRVIVGEVRGPEVVPMLNAMSQGNDGSIATIHASSSAQAFHRLATYAVQAPERLSFEATNLLVAGAVDVVVHLAVAADGTRVVSSIREVTGADGKQIISNEIWAPGPDTRAVPAAPLRAGTLDRLVAVGLDPAVLDWDRW